MRLMPGFSGTNTETKAESGLDLAEDSLKVVHAGCLSAEKRGKVQIP
jgi:hypothetical protein